MMARFVSMCVLTDKSGNITGCALTHTIGISEEIIEFGSKRFITAKQFYQSVRILRSEESILPTITLTEISNSVDRPCRIIGSAPRTVFQLRTNEVNRRIEIVLIVMCTLGISYRIFDFSHFMCHSSNSPIIYCILHRY